MNHVDRSDEFAASGRSLATDLGAGIAARQATASEASRLDEARALVEAALEKDVPEGLKVWAARMSDGFAVQGLVDGAGRTYISCALNGQYQTFDVEPEDAVEAFGHPFAYGCTLPL